MAGKEDLGWLGAVSLHGRNDNLCPTFLTKVIIVHLIMYHQEFGNTVNTFVILNAGIG